MTPYFGTEMREEYVKAGFYQERKGFKDYNGYTSMVRTTGLDYAEVTLAQISMDAQMDARIRIVVMSRTRPRFATRN